MKPVKNNEFFCRCDPEGVARCDEMLVEAEKMVQCEAEHPDFLGTVLSRISSVVAICSDQWFSVGVEISSGGRSVQASFQCDDPLDGLCAAMLWLRQEEQKNTQEAMEL